jgi:hypothetical protein
MILEPLGLHDTFYADGPHSGPAAAGPVMSRVPRALYMLQDCLMYQPEPCHVNRVQKFLHLGYCARHTAYLRSWPPSVGRRYAAV